MLDKRSGFSLIEVVIAAGILSLVALGSMTIIGNLNSELAASNARVATISLSQDVRSTLSSSQLCLATFNNFTIPANLNLIPFNDGLNVSSIGVIKPGEVFSKYNVFIKNIYLSNIVSAGPNLAYFAELVVEPTSGGSSPRTFKPVVLSKLRFQLNSSRQVVACGSDASGDILNAPRCTGSVDCDFQSYSSAHPSPSPSPVGWIRNVKGKLTYQQCKCEVLVSGDQLCINCYGYDPPQQILSCFVAGTQVTMADLSSKPIENVKIGDLVLGLNGTINQVLKVERVPLGDRSLYGINGEKPFVTAEHPFFAYEGWKSFSPNATYAESPKMPISGKLGVGDLILRGNDWVTINEITMNRPGPESLPVYNLILDGDNTYEANGFRVHNKPGE